MKSRLDAEPGGVLILSEIKEVAGWQKHESRVKFTMQFKKGEINIVCYFETSLS